MQYFVYGLMALLLVLFVMRAFTRASTVLLARRLRIAAGIAAGAVAFGLILRGAAGYAMPLAALALWLLAGHGMAPGGGGQWGGGRWGRGRWGGGPGGGSTTTRVVTEYLEAELDHVSGEVTGRVLKGMFTGRPIERLKPAELALLWQDCRFTDPPSAAIVEAYLDRVHPSWREDMARGEAEMAQGPDGRMTRAEAAEILGVAIDADETEIRRAHRELMLKLHPDRGGSTYLAAKINEAKAVLLAES